MNSDTSDFLLPNDQYRYAENVRPITDKDHNTGELHLVEGVLPVNILKDDEEILSFSSIRNYLVYITKEGDGWNIYRYDKDSSSQKLIFGRCTDELLWDNDHPYYEHHIRTVLRWESNKNIKLYIADGIHEVLSINIAKINLGSSFNSLFGYRGISLKRITATISQKTGHIPAARVLYLYRLYKENESASSMSAPSNILSLYKDSKTGFERETTTDKAVDISISNTDEYVGYNIQIYRVNYVLKGLTPSIHLIIDEPVTDTSYTNTDTGVNIEEVSSSEFLSLISTDFIPNEIESKDDYLFAGNIKYKLDIIDQKLAGFDTRSYSKGNYIIEGGTNKKIVDSSYNIIDVGSNQIQHTSFDTGSIPIWDDNDWGVITNGFNGIGKHINWKYVYVDHDETVASRRKTYRDGDVYRFGIRFFTNDGGVSSVKWITDILMHGKLDNSTPLLAYIGVLFTVNIPNEFDFITGYEIVRCNKTIADSYTITQGITGFPFIEKNTLSNPGIFSHSNIRVNSKVWFYHTDNGDVINESALYNNIEALLTDKYTMFASPEICYQPDDVEELLKEYSSYEIQPRYKKNIFSALSDSFNTNEHTSILRGATAMTDGTMRTAAFYPSDLSDIDVYTKIKRLVTSTTSPNSMRCGGLPFMVRPRNSSVGIKLDDYYITASMMEVAKTYKVENYTLYTMLYLDTLANSGLDGSLIPGRDSYYVINYCDTLLTAYSSVDINTPRSVETFCFVKAPKYNGFKLDGLFLFTNDNFIISNTRFINWTVPLMANLDSDYTRMSHINKIIDYSDPLRYIPYYFNGTVGDDLLYYGLGMSIMEYPISPGGPLMLFKTNNAEDSIFIRPGTYSGDTSPFPQVIVENLRKPANPYGGYNSLAIKNSVYYSYGNFQSCDVNSITSYVSELYDGECMIQDFVYHAAYFMYNATGMNNVTRMLTVYRIPIETEIDIYAQCGLLFGFNTTEKMISHDPSSFGEYYLQDKYDYLYNTAYSAQPTLIAASSNTSTAGETETYDTRIIYSEKKQNNEKVDSWTNFKAVNYIDVDSRFGLITDMKLFKDKLMFWQENATGIVSVNERTLLNTVDDAQIILGTGKILERFDYISTIYGQKNNAHTACASNRAMYWWDGNQREIMLYKDGYTAIPLSTTRLIKNHINANLDTTIPSVGYDPKHNEVLFNIVDNKVVTFNENVDAFTAVYTFDPIFFAFAKDQLYVTSNAAIYKYGVNQSDRSFWFDNSEVTPKMTAVVNQASDYVKTFDIQTIGGRFYGGSNELNERTNYRMPEHGNTPLSVLTFAYNTPLKQNSSAKGSDIITNVEYDYRLNIPRNGNNKDWGDRMRGKTMLYTLSSSSNSTDFSLQYVTTKYRTSWT